MEKKVKEVKAKDTTKNRSLAFNTIALITVAIVIAIVVFVNVIFSNVLTWQIDLTENQDFSMSGDAKELLETIDKQVEIVGLFDEVKKDLGTLDTGSASYLTDLYLMGQLNLGTAAGDAYDDAYLPYLGIENSLSYMSIDSVMGILNEFSQTNSNISVSYVDPEDNPLFLTEYLGDSERADEFKKGDFIVKCGNVFKRVTSVELCRTVISSAFTGSKLYCPYAPNVDGGFLSAILYVTAEERSLIGVTTNHGEIGLEDYFTVLQSSLQDNVFDITTFDMATEKDYSQYDIIFMVDPVSDITVGEADSLKTYLAGGGNLIVLADPRTEGAGGLELANLNGVLEYFNLQLNNDKIQGGSSEVTTDGYLMESIIVSNTGPLTDVLDTSYQVQIPAARSISYLSKTGSSLDAGMVIKTSNEAYTLDYTSGQQSGVGSKCIVAVAEDTSIAEGGKVFVAGSASMFADGCATVASSVDMMVRVCTWMEESVNYKLPIKMYTAASITVTETSATILGIVSVALFPVVAFAVGIFIWLRRRHL